MQLDNSNPAISNAQQIFHDILCVRKNNPIIHNITNYVAMQPSANILLAAGASPIMAHAMEELENIIALANALVINIGTLDQSWITSIIYAQQYALQKGIPIIFDPVGAGATPYRTQVALKILALGVHIIRGNASEILSLVDSTVKTKGVDASHQTVDALIAAKALADQYQCIVVISGATDIILNQQHIIYLQNGTTLFTRVTGMGCALTALIGTFAAVNQDFVLATTHAIAFFTIAGEIAAQQTPGPGTFAIRLLDQLATFSLEDLHLLKLSSEFRYAK